MRKEWWIWQNLVYEFTCTNPAAVAPLAKAPLHCVYQLPSVPFPLTCKLETGTHRLDRCLHRECAAALTRKVGASWLATAATGPVR